MFGERVMSRKSRGQRVVQAALKTVAAFTLIAGPTAVLASPPPPSPPPPPPPPTIPNPVKVNGSQFFSWYRIAGNTNYPVTPYPAGAATGTYVGVPFLTDANAAAVNAYLTGLAPGAIRAVKVENPGISNATASLIFNNTNYNVSYVFGDIETATTWADAQKLAKQVRLINPSGSLFSSSNWSKSFKGFVGNFGFSASPDNKQAPTYYEAKFKPKHSYSGYQFDDATSAFLTMSNEEIYPGSPSMRNKAAPDTAYGGGTIPNIRGNLFVLPLWRAADATNKIQSLGSLSQFANHVPWTGNFNNWGNPALDTDRNPANGYLFVPGAAMPAATINGVNYPAMTAAQTTDQNLSRRDSASLALHLRLRGVDSFHLLDSGIVGVSKSDMEQDFASGWLGEANVNSIFAQSDKRMLVGMESIPTSYNPGGTYDGGYVIWAGPTTSTIVSSTVEKAAAVFSGTYSLTLGKLEVIITNENNAAQWIRLPSTIGGYALAVKDFTVGAGDSWMVSYSLTGSGKSKGWTVAAQHVPFTAIENARHHFGIPEPGTLSLLAVAGVFGLNRRKRQAS